MPSEGGVRALPKLTDQAGCCWQPRYAVDASDPARQQRLDGCAARREHNRQGSRRQAGVMFRPEVLQAALQKPLA